MGTRDTRMKHELYTCIHVGNLPAQALLRQQPHLKSEPVAILEGRTPQEYVCSFNHHARLRGVVSGITRLEAERIPGIRLFPRSAESEATARAVIQECAAVFSPRVEDVSSPLSVALVLDIAGTERLFGLPDQLAHRLRASLSTAGFRCSIAVSVNFHTARLKSASSRGITIIPSGEESAALATLHIAALDLDNDALDTFALWGIRTFNELANLPETDLVIRLGAKASLWRQLATGTAEHTFQPIEPILSLEESCEFETPVEQIDSLLFIGARMIDCLAARTATRALSVASISVCMGLESGKVHQVTVRPALPTTDRKFLLKLLQLQIGSNPPPSAVTTLTLKADAGQSGKVQLGLFVPQTPEPSRLDVTLARLKALVGDDRVGSPVLDDTNRPGSFHIAAFSVEKVPAVQNAHARIALRRIRPPRPIQVDLCSAVPAAFRSEREWYTISAAYGPWKTSGSWWSTDGWDAEEWDVLASGKDGSTLACLLVYDRARREWLLEALYD